MYTTLIIRNFSLTNVIGSWSRSSCGQSTVSTSPKPSSRPRRCIPQRQERVTKHQKGARSRTNTYHRPLCPRPEPATPTEIEWPYNCSTHCSSYFEVRISPNKSVTYPPHGSSTPEQMNEHCIIGMCSCCSPKKNYLNDSGVCDPPNSDSFLGGEYTDEPQSYALPPAPWAYHLHNAPTEGPRFLYAHAFVLGDGNNVSQWPPEDHHYHPVPQSSCSSKAAQNPQINSTPQEASTQSSTSSGDTTYSCQRCRKKFTQARNQLRHEKSSCDRLEKHTRKQFRCTICEDDRCFSRADGLDKHMKVVHRKCSKCNKEFDSSEKVAEHRAANRYHTQCDP
jgi:hypothetical protein